MQLMPATAQAVSRELASPSRGRLVRDPDYNVRLGALTWPAARPLRRRAGPGAGRLQCRARPRDAVAGAERRPARPGPYRMIDWIELIPFAETRNYVQRVLEGRGMYRDPAGPAGARPPDGAAASPAVPRSKPAPERPDLAGKACVFDAYGTLLDVATRPSRAEARHWATGARRAVGALAAQAARVHVAAVADAPPRRLRAGDRRGARLSLATWASHDAPLRARLLAAYRRLAPFPRSAGAARP